VPTPISFHDGGDLFFEKLFEASGRAHGGEIGTRRTDMNARRIRPREEPR
jgi:hypothetical protein